MYRSLFIIKTVCIIALLFATIWIAITWSSETDTNLGYIRVIDPSQSPADLQQTKNTVREYLREELSQSIGLVLWSDSPFFLMPPTYDTGTLQTYVDSIQHQDIQDKWDIAPLLDAYSDDNIFVSSDAAHIYQDIQDFANIDTSIQIGRQTDSPTSLKVGILSILLIIALFI